MKYFLEENVKELICFKPACWIQRNLIVVHTHDVNPVDYVIASIIGAGLRDDEIMISLAEKIHLKIKETGTTFRLSAENLFCSNANEICIDLLKLTV